MNINFNDLHAFIYTTSSLSITSKKKRRRSSIKFTY